MIELLLPRTDAGALAQAAGAAAVYGAAAIVVRRNRELLTLVAGLAMITFAFFALRTLH